MTDIGPLSPSWRIRPVLPGAGHGKESDMPVRKPGEREQQKERQRRRREDDDDTTHIDEYA
ncbi:MAG TPA: hypothetical protein ENK05_10770 [Gammaproteobacteria bacterium]|nr:hypothetical protein [Gammaproteobacteria bacterium]